MSAVDLERRLFEAFADARATVQDSPDLFARVSRSLQDSIDRRRWRWKLAGWLTFFIAANAALALGLAALDTSVNHTVNQTGTGPQSKGFNMSWWVIELITNIVLVALAVGLGPFIKRFGRSYAADVFRANPRTGKSYLVLTDVAYYLIFTSFVLFTVTFVQPRKWQMSTGAQLKDEVARIGGILLIMGILHAANVVALPIIGGLLSTNNHPGGRATPPPSNPSGFGANPPLGAGTWILRIEPSAEPTVESGTPPDEFEEPHEPTR